VTRDGLPDIEHARYVGLQQPFESLRRKVLERCAVLHSGIVDEDVDPSPLCLMRVDRRAHRGMVGRVEAQRGHCRTLRAQDLCRSREFCRVASVENDRRAGLRHAARQGEADPLRGTRHEGAAPAQIEQTRHGQVLCIPQM